METETEERIYYQRIEGASDAATSVYTRPGPPRQIAESLRRSRRHGYEFPLAWKVALRRVAWPWSLDERCEWHEVLQDPAVVEVWRAAYERRAYKALDAPAAMRTVIEESDVGPAAYRHSAIRHGEVAA